MEVIEASISPIFSTSALLFEDGCIIPDHIEAVPTNTLDIMEASGGWIVSLFNGRSSLLVACNLSGYAQAEIIARAKVRYQEQLVKDGIFSGTESVLIQSPDGKVTKYYEGIQA